MSGQIDDSQIDWTSPAGDLVLDGSGGHFTRKNNLEASAAPDGSASFGAGYKIGSLWQWGSRVWRCYGDSLWAELSASVVVANNGTGGTITRGQPVFIASDGDMELAQADDGDTCLVVGLVQSASVSAGNPAVIQIDGPIFQPTTAWDALTGGSSGLTPGAVYVVSPSTPGALVERSTITTAGHLICPVLQAVSATEAVVKILPRLWL